MPEQDELRDGGLYAGGAEAPGLAELAGKTTDDRQPTIDDRRHPSGVKIGVVGPCGAGKSTLVRALRERGLDAREIAQEHSGVPAMWQRVTRPDLLVYLDVSREIAERRLERELPPDWWAEIANRLAHARAHADLIVETDGLTPEEIAERVAELVATGKVKRHSATPRGGPRTNGRW